MNHLLRHSADYSVCMRTHAYGAIEKRWFGAAIGAAVGIASSIIGGSAAAKAQEEAEKKAKEDNARKNAWFKYLLDTKWTDTPNGQATTRRANEVMARQTKKAMGAQAVGGGTSVDTALAKEQANKTVADIISRGEENYESTKSNIAMAKMSSDDAYAQQQMQFATQRANNISSIAGGVGNALASAGNAVDGAMSKSGNTVAGTAGGRGSTAAGSADSGEQIKRSVARYKS